MKKIVVFIIISFAFLTQNFAQQSTTGPIRPEGIHNGILKARSSNSVLISYVPSYIWYRGCGPTALGMVVGYYDTHGFSDLIDGDASTQTTGANNAMATTDHYNDYSLPIDSYPNLMLDKSSTGGAHTSNCIADYMNTSWSSRNNYWGWSWSNDMGTAFNSYISQRNSEYTHSYNYVYVSAGSGWTSYKTEIDNNRPVVLLVDSNGDGYTDHFVTGIGYDDVNNLYAIYNTWDYSIHWYEWRSMSSSYSWGIYNFTRLYIQFSIQTISNPSIGGNVTGSGNYYTGETVNLVATAETGYDFVDWTEGGSQVSTNPNYSFTASANRDLLANFELEPTVPFDKSVQNITISNAQNDCYDATNIINVAGSGTTVDILLNGSATFIAGEKISFNEGFHAHEGSYCNAYITTTSEYCSQQVPMVSAAQNTLESSEKTVSISDISDNDFDVKIYPNPTSGSFTIDFIGLETTAEIVLMNFQGNKLIQKRCENKLQSEIDINNMPAGMYIIVIKTTGTVITKKVLKSY